jgi:hypothetical protein
MNCREKRKGNPELTSKKKKQKNHNTEKWTSRTKPKLKKNGWTQVPVKCTQFLFLTGYPSCSS